ncbi:MAG: hypothetical protein IIT61_06265, partial [Bacteroidales bacterium]|nr:hypothetical protein [Bacteroidales bacterium]
MKRLAIILLLLSMYCCMSAQRTHSLELKLYGGRIVPHRSGMDALAQPLYAGEMNYYFSTRSDNYYDLKYHFPRRTEYLKTKRLSALCFLISRNTPWATDS